MRINKRQLEFIAYLEKCGGVKVDEIDHSKYPKSMVDSLLKKKLIYTKYDSVFESDLAVYSATSNKDNT